jgi:hypothetical protein
MRVLTCFTAVVAFLCWNASDCFAQEGTVARPKNGVQHPDLDKAWGEHTAAVEKFAERIATAIDKQFDAATDKADLDVAEKWQVVGNRFKDHGELPDNSETEEVVGFASAEYWKAKAELIEAYEAVIKSLTREQQISAAKAAREELRKQQEINLEPIRIRDLRKEFEAIEEDRRGWAWFQGSSATHSDKAYATDETPKYRINKAEREFTYFAKERAGGDVVRHSKYSPTYRVIGVDDVDNVVLIRMTYPSNKIGEPQEEHILRFHRETGDIDSPFGYFAKPLLKKRR